MRTFIYSQNGKEVAKFVTPTGVNGYVDTSIPDEALQGLMEKLKSKLGISQPECPDLPSKDLANTSE